MLHLQQTLGGQESVQVVSHHKTEVLEPPSLFVFFIFSKFEWWFSRMHKLSAFVFSVCTHSHHFFSSLLSLMLTFHSQCFLWSLSLSLTPPLLAQTNMINEAIGVALKNELWSESFWCLAALMTPLDELIYSNFHFMWHTVLPLSLYSLSVVNECSIELPASEYVCGFLIRLGLHSLSLPVWCQCQRTWSW